MIEGEAWAFRVTTIARSNDGTSNDTKMIVHEGCIERTGTTTNLVGSVDTVRTKEDAGAAAWTVVITADDTFEALQIEVTGEAAHTIRWVSRVELATVYNTQA
jgi:hypothetical protein